MQPNTVTTPLKSKADTAIRKVEQTVDKYEYLVLNETDFGLSAALCNFYETKKTLIATTPPGGNVTTIKPSYQEVLEKHQALILPEIIPTWIDLKKAELNDTLFKNIIFNSPALDSVAAFVSNALPFTSFEGKLMFIQKLEESEIPVRDKDVYEAIGRRQCLVMWTKKYPGYPEH
ncbi:hypothetical protein QVD17_03629 [Tagetes erecta]|uniref:Uncharacterized protein n=1 Tax=Tagetes erecta TaxID=13708 RepID=A0AAD8LHV6_TARER|nr:hypothetical protein QVD17_03629 [Tagetes erecta]